MSWKFISGAPVFQQIIEIIQTDIISGKLPPGGKLMPVRELANEAGVNPNTMQRALLQLEEMELIYTRRGSGRYITEDAEKILEVKASIIGRRISGFITDMQSFGLDNTQILELINKNLKGERIDGNDFRMQEPDQEL